MITEMEVLQGKLTKGQKEKFTDIFWRPNVVRQNVDPPVARTGANIRDYYARKGNNLSLPDVQHLATAIVLGADEMHTTDGSGKKTTGTLIPLSGVIAEHYRMVIREPRIQAPPLIATAGFTTV